MPTIAELAHELYAAHSHGIDQYNEVYTTLKPGYPAWMREITHPLVRLHADDWTFAAIRKAARAISRGETGVKADQTSHELFAWMARCPYRLDYLTRVLAQGPVPTANRLLAAAQQIELDEIFAEVQSKLAQQAAQVAGIDPEDYDI